MSRVGIKEIILPTGVTVTLSATKVEVKGPKGTLVVPFIEGITAKLEDTHLHILRPNDDNEMKKKHGTMRALVANAVTGVTKGFKKELEIVGIGFRASLRGANLVLNIGFSHEIVIVPRPFVKISVPEPTVVVVEGIDRQGVGQTASEVRASRKPEPYQGKGIKYRGERIIRKEGKRAGKK
jgi:large subunit ribosomal protein L6